MSDRDMGTLIATLLIREVEYDVDCGLHLENLAVLRVGHIDPLLDRVCRRLGQHWRPAEHLDI